MKTLIIATLWLASCGTRVGYVDPQRAIKQTDEWRTVQAGATAYAESRQPDLDKAQAMLAKARGAKASAEVILADETEANALKQQIDAEVKARLDAGGGKIGAAMTQTLGQFAEAQGVSVVLPATGAYWVDPRLDLTTALAKHYDQGKIQRLEAKVSELEAQHQASPPLAKK